MVRTSSLRRRTPRTATVLAFPALLGAAAAAEPPEPTPRPLVFGVELNVVAVPAIVTDKDGRTVSGLTAQDFEIEEGGKSVAVQGFQAITGDADLQLPEGAGAAVTALSSRRQFVFLFDLGLSSARNVERARAAARDFLDRYVQPRDLVSVVSAHPTGFKTLIGLTSDRFQIRQAIDALGRGDMARSRDPLGLLFDSNLAEFLEGPQTSTPADGGREGARGNPVEDNRESASRLARSQQQLYVQQVTQFLSGFQNLGRALEAIRGRKNVILFSEGFDASAIMGARGQQQANAAAAVVGGQIQSVDSDAYFGSVTGQNAMDGMFAALRGSDVVVHAVDIGVLGGDMMALDQQGGNRFSGSLQDSLATFAASTGGRYVRGANNLSAALKEIADSTKDYYVLAFAPSGESPGKPRKLRIRVKRDGLKVAHRPSYVPPDPKKPDAARAGLQASEIVAKGITGGSLKISAFTMPYRSLEKGYGVPLVLQIAPEVMAETLKRKETGIEVFGYLLDATGAIRDYFRATPALDAAAVGDRVKSSGLQILTTFAAGEGPHEVRILVRDSVLGRFGSMRLALEVPALTTGPFVSTPMFVDDPFRRVALPTVTQRRKEREIPFRIGDRPFTVESDPVLKKGAAREVCLFVRPASGRAPEVTASLIGEDGIAIPVAAENVRVVRDADGFDRLVFSLKAQNLQPGPYTLEIAAAGATRQAAVHVQ